MLIYVRLVSSLMFKYVIISVNAQEKMLCMWGCNCPVWGVARGEVTRINRLWQGASTQEVGTLAQITLQYLGSIYLHRDVPRVHEMAPTVLSSETWNLSSKK